jgi:hypothetical protein
MKQLFKTTESVFGVDPWLMTQNFGDEEEHHEAS